ncbi:uncharacterized protein ARMOST_12465 [Armillaria ostoyae]|uniref:Uncharacterized protein n=1 Tax=Armillaria ostoyae TaxID=47428 RepID=A0A284RK08_ARMOS|nr:uncharacterized protein ARMOST_12465 [Armillaria ostoyae]
MTRRCFAPFSVPSTGPAYTHCGDIMLHMPRMSDVHVCILRLRMIHPDILQRTALYGCVTFLGSRNCYDLRTRTGAEQPTERPENC